MTCGSSVVFSRYSGFLHHGQATGKLYHLRLQVECTLFCNLQSQVRIHAVLVMGLYELCVFNRYITTLHVKYLAGNYFEKQSLATKLFLVWKFTAFLWNSHISYFGNLKEL
jgi:hypothetical protein